MELYTKDDVEMLNERIDDIVEKIEDHKLSILEPTRDEQLDFLSVVLEYIKEHKLKVYGGYAQNMLVKIKNKDDAFYPEDNIPDIDVYSPSPIEDMIKMSNMLHDRGFKDVKASEALHKETYKIFVNQAAACDLSYVPKNVYYRIPYEEIDGIQYVSAQFTQIDLYRMMTEPMFSSFRWGKIFPRIHLLQKHYPFGEARSKMPKDLIQIQGNRSEHNIVLEQVHDFLKNNTSVIVFGNYAYNQFLSASDAMKDTLLSKKYRFIDVPYYEFTSTNYKEDALKLIKILGDKFGSDNVTLVEHYPFWHFTGYSAYIKVNNNVVAHIIDYNRRCTPIKIVNAKVYQDGKELNSKGKIQLCCYDYALLMALVLGFRQRVEKNSDGTHYYNIMLSHLMEIRNHYLQKKEFTMFDDTLFQEFITTCIGETMDPFRASNLERDAKAKDPNRRGPIVFRYDPASNYMAEPSTSYRFFNSSGNAITNPRNLRIVDLNISENRPRDSGDEKEDDRE